jgi:hypothetical protein
MKRLLPILLLVLFAAGCAHSQQPATNHSLHGGCVLCALAEQRNNSFCRCFPGRRDLEQYLF